MAEQITNGSERPQNRRDGEVRDIRKSLSKEDLEIYNMFMHTGEKHTLANLRTARNKFNMLKALKECRGYVGKACDQIGINRRTYYGYVAEDPLFAEMVMEIREEQVDRAEDKLLDNIDKGFEASIIFYLKTQGRRRGYADGNATGAFNGTQEDYYKNMFKGIDDTQLLDEIKSLRSRLKIGDDVEIGGFNGANEEFEELPPEFFQEEDDPTRHDVVIDITGKEHIVRKADDVDSAHPDYTLEELENELRDVKPDNHLNLIGNETE